MSESEKMMQEFREALKAQKENDEKVDEVMSLVRGLVELCGYNPDGILAVDKIRDAIERLIPPSPLSKYK